ncbi:MAG TPA: hypothetical protein VKA89_07360 [Solirubrobacterales bacterium]|nr:hypothetical protein [Solirubrobacterales bacterium]
MRLLAPAKLNLCLYLGRRRSDGLHQLCSLFEPLTLADVLEVEEGDRDEVRVDVIEGEDLAARALRALREAGFDGPPLRISVKKQIPVAAGLGGGSADAGAVLRLGAGEVAGLEAVAQSLGADVPSQLRPATALVTGAGEDVRRLPDPAPHAFVLLPGGGGLPTADVFAEADRQGLGRSAGELAEIELQLAEAAGDGSSPLTYTSLLANDLEPAALALRPGIGEGLDALRAAGAAAALITGSGPTAFGLFEDLGSARLAADRIGRGDAIVCASGVPA